jgi:hypothetical protein
MKGGILPSCRYCDCLNLVPQRLSFQRAFSDHSCHIGSSGLPHLEGILRGTVGVDAELVGSHGWGDIVAECDSGLLEWACIRRRFLLKRSRAGISASAMSSDSYICLCGQERCIFALCGIAPLFMPDQNQHGKRKLLRKVSMPHPRFGCIKLLKK